MLRMTFCDDGSTLRCLVQDKSRAPKTLLRFSAENTGEDLLSFIHFSRELTGGENLFTAASALLPARLNALLFYFYLLYLDRPRGEASGPDAFQKKWKDLMKKAEQIIAAFRRQQKAAGLQLKCLPEASPLFPGLRLYLIESAADYVHFSLCCLLPQLAALSRCKVCGAYFLRSGQQKGELCAYEKRDGLSCTARRCRKNAAERLARDPLLQLYRKVYKRQYMRCERALDLADGRICSPGNYPPFRAWSRRAKAERKAYRAGLLDAESFREKLDALDREILYKDLQIGNYRN